MNVKELNIKSKCIFAVRLAERASKYLKEYPAKKMIDKAVEISWKWIYTEENAGEILYHFWDNEEDGFTLFQEMEENEKNISVWE